MLQKESSTDQAIIIPVIEIEGAADIAEGVTLGGEGILSLESGGHLSIKGTVESGEQIDFADGTGRVSIGNPTAFSWNTWVYPQWQVPEWISRGSKLNPWAYTLRP